MVKGHTTAKYFIDTEKRQTNRAQLTPEPVQYLRHDLGQHSTGSQGSERPEMAEEKSMQIGPHARSNDEVVIFGIRWIDLYSLQP